MDVDDENIGDKLKVVNKSFRQPESPWELACLAVSHQNS